MIIQILAHTPLWVWGLFVLLLVLGFSQTRPSNMGLLRVTLMPLAMGSLSAYGTASAFGMAPTVLLAWLGSALFTATLVLQRPVPPNTRFDADTQSFHQSGSWTPLALMMGIFFTKYGVGVVTALHPALVQDGTFTLAFSALYGAFSGVFAARALRLVRLAHRPAADAHQLGHMAG